MNKTMGTWETIARITCGIVGLAWSTSRMVRTPCRTTPWIVAMLAGYKIATGVLRFCPFSSKFRSSGKRQKDEIEII